MRDAWLPLGLVLLVGGAVPLACGQAFELTGGPGTGSASGTGGASSGPITASGGTASTSAGDVASTSAGSSTSTGMVVGKPCAGDAECATASDSLCGAGRCSLGHCAYKILQPDGPSYSQLYGDCHVTKCASAQVTNEKNNDVYDDGNECTDDVCNDGTPANNPNAGNDCGANGICDGAGACVQCTSGDTSKCEGGKKFCVNGYCSGANCLDGIKDGNETDKDCGGDGCEPCDASAHCMSGSDCKSKVCALPAPMAPGKLCLIAICSDGVKNGDETDVDCGGTGCPDTSKCAQGKHCALPADCKSGVCQAGVCQKETCSDGVKNGLENGIDCGAAGCAVLKCPGG